MGFKGYVKYAYTSIWLMFLLFHVPCMIFAYKETGSTESPLFAAVFTHGFSFFIYTLLLTWCMNHSYDTEKKEKKEE